MQGKRWRWDEVNKAKKKKKKWSAFKLESRYHNTTMPLPPERSRPCGQRGGAAENDTEGEESSIILHEQNS